MHVLLLLLDTVSGDNDIDDNDSDTASQEATPTSSAASAPEHATSFLPKREEASGEGKQTNNVSVFYPSLYL